MRYVRRALFLSLISLITVPGKSNGDVTLNGVFSDHMVLQRDRPLPVWGTAAPGESIVAQLAGQTVTATADAAGHWKVRLKPLFAPQPAPLTLTVRGRNLVTVKDILVGDVWLCSGQSNMAFTMNALKDTLYADDLKTANYPLIRQGTVRRAPSLEPVETTPVSWVTCSPETIGDFTAVGFYFARAVQPQIGVPIGLIHSSWGGTSAEAWTSLSALGAVPAFKSRAERQIAEMKAVPEQTRLFPEAIAAWERRYQRVDPGVRGEASGWAEPNLSDDGWKTVPLGTRWQDAGFPDGGVLWMRKVIDVPPGAAGKSFRLDLGKVDEQYETTYFNGRRMGGSGKEPPLFYSRYIGYTIPGSLVKAGKNVIAVRFVAPHGNLRGTSRNRTAQLGLASLLAGADPDDNCQVRAESTFTPLPKGALEERPICPSADLPHTSSCLFNGMIHPLTPFPVKGVLWYQGEQDAGRAFAYRTLLPLMIQDWRTRWGQPDLPFYVQQLPNWQAVSDGPEESAWAELREAQWLTARALPNVGLAVGIDVGETDDVHPKNKRDIGARLARVALAKSYGKAIDYSGPEYRSQTIEGNTIRLHYRFAGGLRSSDGRPLARFAIAGSDKKWVNARAVIAGETILVSSPQVPAPVAVRYAWANNPLGCNLTNASGLPALPFRTDDWKGVTADRP